MEDQEVQTDKKKAVRLKEMQAPPALLPPKMWEMPSQSSLMTVKSLRREKRGAAMKR